MRFVLGIVVCVGCSYAPPRQAGGDDAVADGPFDGTTASGRCDPLPRTPPFVMVSDATELAAAVQTTTAGTIEVADGTYDLADTLAFGNAGVTLRSASGNAATVILNRQGGTPAIAISASNVTIASLTITNSGTTTVHVEPTIAGDTTGISLHDVTFVDNRGPIRLRAFNNNAVVGPYPDNGTIACSRFAITPAGDPCSQPTMAITGDGVRGWTIRDNRFEGHSCQGGFVRTVRFSTGSRDITIANNTFVNAAANLMMGQTATATARPYVSLPAGCTGTPSMVGGLVCNNVITALDLPPIVGNTDFEEGIALWDACDTWVMHNTVVSPGGIETFTNIEYRFAGTIVHLVNNLLFSQPVQRDGNPTADHLASNVTYASEADFVDARTDLRIAPASNLALGEDITAVGMCATDAAGMPRALAAPTVGAYER